MPWTLRRRVCEIDADRSIDTHTQRTPVVCTEVGAQEESEDGGAGGGSGEIVVRATSPGLQSARLAIPLSLNSDGPAGDGVLAVAARSIGQADLGAAGGDLF